MSASAIRVDTSTVSFAVPKVCVRRNAKRLIARRNEVYTSAVREGTLPAMAVRDAFAAMDTYTMQVSEAAFEAAAAKVLTKSGSLRKRGERADLIRNACDMGDCNC